MFFNLIIIFVILCGITGNECARSFDGEFRHPSFASSRSQVPNPHIQPMEYNSEFWIEQAQKLLHGKVKAKFNTNKAKNIIMFLGDGMSLETLAVTRVYAGSEQHMLSFEKFPHIGLSKTYCVDTQVADSACTATAYLAGIKNNMGTSLVSAKVRRGECDTGIDPKNQVYSIAKWAQDAGKGTGIVTTTRITHASPAGNYAHVAERNWESDYDVAKDGCDPNKVADIAKQLVQGDVGKKFKVILGGGRYEFINNTMFDEEEKRGRRIDGLNLIDEWKMERSKLGHAEYVWDNRGLKKFDAAKTDYLLGLFEDSHCYKNLDIKLQQLQETEPTLTEMTEAAIKVLEKEPNGFYLFVEGGLIDHTHHANTARYMVNETEEFANAIDLARRMTSEDDTLIVVTSDHGHTMTYSGYADRGHDILGVSDLKGSDGLPYTTISYANGMGFYNTYKNKTGIRYDFTTFPQTDPKVEYAALSPAGYETHAGHDVGVFASGPWSHIFSGTYEQNNIPILMAYAAQIGEFEHQQFVSGAGNLNLSSKSLVILLIVYIFEQHCVS